VSATGQNIALTGSGSDRIYRSVAGSSPGVTVTYADGTTSQGTVGSALGKPDEAQPERRFRHDRQLRRNGFSANGVHYDVFYASIRSTPADRRDVHAANREPNAFSSL